MAGSVVLELELALPLALLTLQLAARRDAEFRSMGVVSCESFEPAHAADAVEPVMGSAAGVTGWRLVPDAPTADEHSTYL